MTGKGKSTISALDSHGGKHSIPTEADIETGINRQAAQLSVPGTEAPVPPGILRQAKRVLELRNDAKLAKQRADAAHDFLLSAMKKAAILRFVLDEPNMASPITFRVKASEEKMAMENYRKPHLPDPSSAVG
jgi:hypothetical protein